jgi:aspartate racemase
MLGIIGGIAPESTIDFYRSLIGLYQERNSGNYPPLLIDSIDLRKMLALVSSGSLSELATYLGRELERLADAGATIALLASNTPHIVFDELRAKSPIPLISIVEETAREARRLGLKRLGLFGTRFTMEARFYPDVFARDGIAVIAPPEPDRTAIHDKYMNELANGVFEPATHDLLAAIAGRFIRSEQLDGLILAGTELPLILRETSLHGVPLLNTTQIHVRSALEALQTSRSGSTTNAR